MTTPQDIDRNRAQSIYDADLHHLALLADEPKGANPWPGIAAIWAAIALACILIFSVSGCSAPSAQQDAEATEATVQDAQTAALQVHLDAACGHLVGKANWACALRELQRLQPDRWIPEDAARAAMAVPYAITTNEE